MTLMPQTVVRPREIVQILKKHVWLWATPVVVCTAGAALYGLLREPTWRATQALYVRDEAVGKLGPPGRFENIEAMKTAQETILEVARNHSVVKSALEQVGPRADRPHPGAWPGEDDIDSQQDDIRVTAPKGAEFGRTEVIYVSVDAATPQRAVALTRAVCDQLDNQLRELRNERAKSIIRELQKTLELARADLSEATGRLEQVESEVGSDLGELRVLNDIGAGDSNLRGALREINNELRQAQTKQTALEQQHKLLLAARDDPEKLVATPNQLLEAQPALRRLKDGLVDAQLKTAELAGKMSPNHPLVKAAMESERQVRGDLHREVEVALRGVNADLEVNRVLVASLEKQAKAVESRLDRLASLRARYGNLVSEVRQRAQLVEQAQEDLADARAQQSAAESASLITRIDEPVTDNEPLGPGLGAIVLIGFGGGLMIGVGLVFLTVPMVRMRGRRWSDLFPGGGPGEGRSIGRRADDRAAHQGAALGRRASDRQPTNGAPSAASAETSAPEATPFDTTLAAATASPPPATGGDRRQGDRRGGDRRAPAPVANEPAAAAEKPVSDAPQDSALAPDADCPSDTTQASSASADDAPSRLTLARSLRRLEGRG